MAGVGAEGALRGAGALHRSLPLEKSEIETTLEAAALDWSEIAPSILGTLFERGLDPACGSGNFLCLALHALKDLEHRVQLEAEAMGFQRAFPAVGPANVRAIEINAYAAELARVSVWFGEIQWMRRNGFNESRDSILKPLEAIECRDAILTPEGREPEWPAADAIIGNPPFLGGKVLNTHLGEDYVSRIFKVYAGRVPAEADLVCYWFDRPKPQSENQSAYWAMLRVGLGYVQSSPAVVAQSLPVKAAAREA